MNQELIDHALKAFSFTKGLSPIVFMNDESKHEYIGDAVVSIGAFDGVHLGHQFILEHMIESAHKANLPAVIVTFNVDPDEYFRNSDQVMKLVSNRTRHVMLANLGADYIVSVKFTPELAQLSHKEFFEDYLGRFMSLRQIHVGNDFKLGKARSEDINTIKAWGEARSCEVFAYDLLTKSGEVVSSSRIREALLDARLDEANSLLGRPYTVIGTVIHGRGAGRTFGLPTANISLDQGFLFPADGVYAGLVQVDEEIYPTAINVGIPPTFQDEEKLARLELYILGFDDDIYGHIVKVAFVNYIRPLVTFENKEELIRIITQDIEITKDLLGAHALDLM
ncbi:MAG: riboflavin biosynthesis protein RibF [Coriobacteriia bacterium]|nr:riboflavin biosynthesis protein RibF [Coriobacteriia bacterium]